MGGLLDQVLDVLRRLKLSTRISSQNSANYVNQTGISVYEGVLEGTFYIIGNNKFYNFPLTEKMVKEAMNEAGIEIEKFTALEAPPHHPEVCDPTALFHTYGRKSAGN